VRYEPAVLPVVVRAGAGSARDAESILDQLLAGSDESGLTYERAVALLGYTDENLLDDVVGAFASGDGAAVFRAVDRVVEGGHDPRRFTADLLDRFRDLIVLAAVPDAGQTGLLDVPADRLDRMREQAAGFGQAQLARAAETVNAGLTEMRGATSPRLQLELICAQVLLPPPAAGDGELLARIERLERRLASAAGSADHPRARPGEAPAARPAHSPAAAPAAAPAPAPDAPRREPPAPGPARQEAPPAPAARPAAATAADAGPLRERWPEILDAVKRERRVAWLLLSNATPDSLQDNVLTLRFTREGEARGFAGSGYERDLGQVLERMLGISPKIRAIAGEGMPEDTPRGIGSGIRGGQAHSSLNVTPEPTVARDAGPAAGGARPRAADGWPGPQPPAPPDQEPDPGPNPDTSALTGVDLIQRTLGGEVIAEIGEP
jgi:DNA polymerase III subunit gamma/tau